MAEMLSRDAYLMAAEKTKRELQGTLQTLNQQQAENRREVSSLVSRAETALSELAAVILADLTPQAIDFAVNLTGYTTLATRSPAAELARAEAKLKCQIATRSQQISARISEIERTPMFENRLLLRAPRTGTLVREIAELEEFRQPGADVLARCTHPRLQRLLEVEYGLPSYAVPFWRLSYFSDWKAGDEIVAKFTGQKTFAEVRSEYLRAKEEVSVYDQKLDKLRAEVQAGETIEREHDSLVAEQKAISDGTHDQQVQLGKMPEQFLKEARIQLERYLSDLDFAAIGDRLQRDPQIEMMAKRYYGLRKQTEYLRQTGNQLLDNSRPAMEQSVARLQRDINKYQRPKYYGQRFPREALDKLTQRNTRCMSLLERQRQAQTTIISFHSYENARLDDDFLWWDLITDGRIKANYIDEVAHFKALHPTYKYQRPKQKSDEVVDDDFEVIDDTDAAVAVIHTSDSYQSDHRHDFS
jgi:hypothetical protein